MSCFCAIIPDSVLRRFRDDPELSAELRRNFGRSLAISARIRRLRVEANRLTRIAGLDSTQAARRPDATPVPAILVDDCRHGTTLPGTPIAKPAKSKDKTARRAFAETTLVAQFYREVFGRNSVDDAGQTLLSSIHYDRKYNNAFWNGSQMTYGDGDGAIFVDFTLGNDVIAHELTHGVTQHSASLDYSDEPGGLNESVSDVFGSMFRQWQAKQTVDQADWLIGHDIIGPQAAAKGYSCLRDMAAPNAKHCLSPQPTHYSQYHPGMDPHDSSGIPNLAFATAAKSISGHSWEKAGAVWYRALTGFPPSPSLTMAGFAGRTRDLASSLFAADTAVHAAIDAAWTGVGL